MAVADGSVMDGMCPVAGLDVVGESFRSALLAGDERAAERALGDWVEDRGSGPGGDVVEGLVVPTITSIGQAWEAGRLSLSDLYLSGRHCRNVTREARRVGLIAGRGAQPRIAACLIGDSHTLGKTLVIHALSSAGYVVSDWGASLGADQVVGLVLEHDTEVLLVSVLTMPAALQVRQLRTLLERAGCRTVLVVGGAPFRMDPQLGAEVGADHVGARSSDVLSILARIEATR